MISMVVAMSGLLSVVPMALPTTTSLTVILILSAPVSVIVLFVVARQKRPCLLVPVASIVLAMSRVLLGIFDEPAKDPLGRADPHWRPRAQDDPLFPYIVFNLIDSTGNVEATLSRSPGLREAIRCLLGIQQQDPHLL